MKIVDDPKNVIVPAYSTSPCRRFSGSQTQRNSMESFLSKHRALKIYSNFIEYISFHRCMSGGSVVVFKVLFLLDKYGRQFTSLMEHSLSPLLIHIASKANKAIKWMLG